MPSLGLSLSLPRTAGSFYDPDALSYFGTAAVTDAIGRTQINNFVTGIKSLGLWNNMVAWPLRSTQNKGSGTTAYSLGGLGVYNGTLKLTNGPTWGTGGITFDGVDDFISTAFTSGLSEFTAFSVATPTNSATNQYEIAKDNPSGTREWAILSYYIGNQVGVIWNTAIRFITGPAYQTTIRSLCLRGSTSVAKFRRNNESDYTSTVGALTQGSAAITIGSTSIGNVNFFKGTIHGTILFNTALTDSETSSMYTLYKTTLGSGLGLP
jgi:hypothetical protein